MKVRLASERIYQAIKALDLNFSFGNLKSLSGGSARAINHP